jgi:TIR domain
MVAPGARTRVFVSYSHRDRKWLDRVKVHLKPLVREGAIELWEDTRITAGVDWRAELKRELTLARVAILLVSADYLASDFVATEELPALLRAAEEDGAQILMLIVSASRFAEGPLARFQAINDADDPLIGMKKPQREDTFVRLAAAVVRAAGVSKPIDTVTASQPGRNLALSDRLVAGGMLGNERLAMLLYDSDDDQEPFSEWMLNAHRGHTLYHYSDGPARSFTMRAGGTEVVGINKSLPVLSGAVTFEYQIADTSEPGWHVYFAMIPMQQSQHGLLEVGATVSADPRNPRSPYRLRVFAPREHYGDGRWHPGRMVFTFHGLPNAAYAIFGPRINEGVEEPKPAIVGVRSVRAWGT